MSTTRNTLIAVFVLVVTFASGVAVGVFGEHLYRRGHAGRRMHEMATSAMVNRLDRHLDLSDEQRRKVEEIIERRHQRINTLWSDVRPRVREELEQANREILVILTPEQRAKFEKLKMRLHGRRGEHERRGDRGRRESTR